MGLLKLGAKALTHMGSSRSTMIALGLGAFGAGVASVAGAPMRDAALDFTTGTPDADKYFIGDKLSARYLAGAAIGGPLGLGFQATDPTNFTRINLAKVGAAGSPVTNTGIGTFGGSLTGAVIGGITGYMTGGMPKAIKRGILGGVGGGILGAAAGGVTSMTANPATAAVGLGVFGGMAGSIVGGLSGSLKGAAKGGLIGGLAFGALGAAAPLAMTSSHVRANNKFYSQSPYARTISPGYQASVSTDMASSAIRNIVSDPGHRSSSLQTAMELNASGNIVLGMHNSRRGY